MTSPWRSPAALLLLITSLAMFGCSGTDTDGAPGDSETADDAVTGEDAATGEDAVTIEDTGAATDTLTHGDTGDGGDTTSATDTMDDADTGVDAGEADEWSGRDQSENVIAFEILQKARDQ